MRTTVAAAFRRALLGSAALFLMSIAASRAMAQELRDQWHQAPRDTVTQDVYDGWKQFNLRKQRCCPK